MSLSVSSEQAFSQGGLTITKRRNRLKGDIVEALQCVKCAIWHDLLFREPSPSSAVEVEIDDEDDRGNDDVAPEETAEGWDEILIDNNDVEMDVELYCD